MQDLISRRGMLKGAAMVSMLSASAVTFESCNAASVLSELETWVPIGLSAFDTLVTYINPAAGSAIQIAITTANGLWDAVATAIANYQHTTDPTTTLLDKVIAALDALDSGLGGVFAALPIGIPAVTLKAIQFGLSLLISTLRFIQGKIEPTPQPAGKHAKAKEAHYQGVPPASSKSEFITQFNAKVCVAAGYQARLK